MKPTTETKTTSRRPKKGRCRTCEHWRRHRDALDVVNHGEHAGLCGSSKFAYGCSSQTPRDGLQYWDYEGYSAGFETGEDFGCVHWTAIEKPKEVM